MMQNKLAIKLENISKEFAGKTVLHEINLQVSSGSIHGLLGPNGAGKSTTMNIICGLLKATSGTVTLFDQVINVASDRAGIKHLVGYMPEKLPIYYEMKGRDYLLFVGKIYGVSSKEIKVQLDFLIQKLQLESIIDRLIGNLSKGQKQRIGLAASLIFNPKILVLDEPTVGLDPASIHEFRSLLVELKRNHTILLSTHQLHEVSLLCDEVTIINRGRIAWNGPIFDLHQHSESKNQKKIKLSIEMSEWNEEIKQELLKNRYIKNIKLDHFEEESLENLFLDLTRSHTKEVDHAKATRPIH